MHTRPHSAAYFRAGCLLVIAPMTLVGYARDPEHSWQWLAMGAAVSVVAVAAHMFLAWWRDRFELYFPGEPDPDTTRYQLFMDRCARAIAWSIGIRWDRP